MAALADLIWYQDTDNIPLSVDLIWKLWNIHHNQFVEIRRWGFRVQYIDLYFSSAKRRGLLSTASELFIAELKIVWNSNFFRNDFISESFQNLSVIEGGSWERWIIVEIRMRESVFATYCIEKALMDFGWQRSHISQDFHSKGSRFYPFVYYLTVYERTLTAFFVVSRSIRSDKKQIFGFDAPKATTFVFLPKVKKIK